MSRVCTTRETTASIGTTETPAEEDVVDVVVSAEPAVTVVTGEDVVVVEEVVGE